MINSYLIVSIIGLAIISWGAWFVSQHKHKMSEMHCMMNGMIFGMLTGFFVGAMYVLGTGNYLIGNIVGTLTGLAGGVIVGRMGGPLSRMEGVMAGPMGGLMGAMFGQMIALYNLKIVMIFIISLVILVTGETVYMMLRSVEMKKKVDVGFLSIISIAMIFLVGFMNYTPVGSTLAFTDNNISEKSIPFEQVVAQTGEKKSTLSADGSSQTVAIDVQAYNYSPAVVIVKKGVPVTMTLNVDPKVGCGRSFIMNKFGIHKNLQVGMNQIVFTPTETGSFPFSCAMNMLRGIVNVV